MSPEWLLILTRKRNLATFYSTVLLFGLAALADGWLLVRAARVWGLYLALAIEASTAVVAAVIVGSTIGALLRTVRAQAYAGTYSLRTYTRYFTVVLAATLLFLPGFASDGIGLLLYLPPGRQLFGWWFGRRYREQIRSVYEYVKLDLFSGGADGPPRAVAHNQPMNAKRTHQNGPQEHSEQPRSDG